MAVYKIPQDVEADDKFVGPLSFKQFIFCGVGLTACYLTFIMLSKGLWPVSFIFLPIIIVTGFLGFPWGRDQPTEIWLAARIRFFIKPRLRIWNQSGIKDLVTVTAPKHIERHYTNGLSQNEVSSRLSGLADLLDSRGWAVKNVNVNLYSTPITGVADAEDDDRLLAVAALPQEVVEVSPGADILDEASSPTAQHFEAMIKTSEEKHRQGIMDQLNAARSAPAAAEVLPGEETEAPNAAAAHTDHEKADFWFLQQGGHKKQEDDAAAPNMDFLNEKAQVDSNFTTFQTANVVAPHTAAVVPPTIEEPFAAQVSAQDEQALLQKIHKDQQEEHNNGYGHMKTIMPIGDPVQATTSQQQAYPQAAYDNASLPPVAVPQTYTPPYEPVQNSPQQPAVLPLTEPVTAPVNPAILKLASNDDLNVATLARQADKAKDQSSSDDEVVISLR